MIDVKGTILATIKEKLFNLMYLADNDLYAFKKIISLIILDDILDWSVYLDANQAIQKKLIDLRKEYIHNNCEFKIAQESYLGYYTNVNTPLNNSTWLRVWDSPNLTDIDSTKVEDTTLEHITYWEPDPSCKIELVYYTNITTSSGAPEKEVINPIKLTICERMNVYVNRESNQVFILDENCNWVEIEGSVSEDTIARIAREHNFNSVKHEVNTSTHTIDIKLTNPDGDHIEDLTNLKVANASTDIDDLI